MVNEEAGKNCWWTAVQLDLPLQHQAEDWLMVAGLSPPLGDTFGGQHH